MELNYPISSELLTFVHKLNRSIEQALRRECNLSVVQYRAMSCMRQAGELEERSMERIMATSASQLSQGLGKLAKCSYAQSRHYRGPVKLWRLTAKGNRAIENADAVLIETCNQVFGPLGAQLGSAIRAGSMLTNQRHGVVRIEDGRFFEEHACFEAFLQAERITKESTQSFGLTETEFRIMFELYTNGPASKSKLARILLMAPSVITDACKPLIQRDLLATAANIIDKRTNVMVLTLAGRELTVKAGEYVDARSMEDLRPSSTEERALYQQMACIVVNRP